VQAFVLVGQVREARLPEGGERANSEVPLEAQVG
jgi:hypothetical protein